MVSIRTSSDYEDTNSKLSPLIEIEGAFKMTTPWLSLAKQLAFVTGGGSGIGAAVAIGLAKAGADVIVADRNVEAARATAILINTRINAAGLGGKAKAVSVDVSKLDDVEKAVKEGEEEFRDSSSLMIAVNCAGITIDKFMTKMDENDWDRVLDVNLKGTFFVTKTTSKAM